MSEQLCTPNALQRALAHIVASETIDEPMAALHFLRGTLCAPESYVDRAFGHALDAIAMRQRRRELRDPRE